MQSVNFLLTYFLLEYPANSHDLTTILLKHDPENDYTDSLMNHVSEQPPSLHVRHIR
jgi:hypothetical protein